MVRSTERLASDQQKLEALVESNPEIVSIASATGRPPYRYLLELRCRGIGHVSAGQPVFRETHAVEILLGPEYPFREPAVTFTHADLPPPCLAQQSSLSWRLARE